MDHLLTSAQKRLDHQKRVSSLYSFSVKVAAYDWRELRFSKELCRFSGQIRSLLTLLKRRRVQPELR